MKSTPKANAQNREKQGKQVKPTRTKTKIGMTSVPSDPVDRLLATDFVLVRLGREVRRQQGLLRESCSDEAWRVYLRIEELMNERMYSFADKWVAEAKTRPM
jgi:hypothetical protein